MSSKNFYGLTGDVTVDGGILNVGNAQLYANTETSNVGVGTTNPEFELDVHGNANVGILYSTFLHGDGSNIQNIVSSQWEGSPGDPIYYTSNVGIANTSPITKTLQVGSNLYVEDEGSNVLHVTGNIYADYLVGDGSQLTGIAASLDQIVDQGNTVSNTIQIVSGQDATSNVGLVTHEGVGISVSNVNPTGEYQFGVGSNLLVNVNSSNVLTVDGNVFAQKMTLGTVTVTPAYNLQQITETGPTTNQTLVLSNVTTGLTADANVVVDGNVTAGSVITSGNVNAGNVITSSNIEVGGDLSVTGNVYIDDMRVAEVASNLVTYDSTTGEIMDSGGLFSNKLAVVSEQPPIALTGASTVVAKHGTYTIEASSGTVVNLFDKVIGESNKWETDGNYSTAEGTEGTYEGSASLAGHTGEWVKITMPYKTILRHIKIESTNQSVEDIELVGLNADGLTWSNLKTETGLTGTTHTIIVNATTHHRTYGLIVEKTNTTTGRSAVEIGDLKLFTESFSIDGGKVEMASSAVMGGETTMDQHGPHSRDPKAVPLKKYPEIVFDASKMDGNDSTNTYIQAGYTVTASSQANLSTFRPWNTFDGNIGNEGWHSYAAPDSFTGTVGGANSYNGTSSLGGVSGAWLKLELPHKIRLSHIDLLPRDYPDTQEPKDFKILGSNDDTNWVELIDVVGATWTQGTSRSFSVTGEVQAYKYLAISVSRVVGSSVVILSDLKYYGYEELATQGDTSVDTTFTSIMNTPQTTGANVYVDGSLGETFTNRVTGPDATGPSATYDETGKYWELNGTLTSNIAVEANTFLEGDAPHSVSVWFNSSNLEANVSNTCVFSVSDQEKLDSVNLDLQSNTWHNLTYAYQGEGGSRVTYLDGRKVAEDQAEDTFGEYPPFAMTGYSRGGYVVSSNSEYNTTSYPVWEAFDDSSSSSWASNTSRFDGSGIATSASVFNPGGGDVNGPYVKIEMPHKLALSYFDIVPQTSTGTACPPKKINLYASNDDTNWVYLLTDEVVNVQPGVTKTVTASTQTKYKYFILQVTEMNPGTSVSAPAQYTWTQISNLSFYGHRENDLVRLPDPTNVLKYPHITLDTSNGRGMYNNPAAKRGYEVTASTYGAGGREPVLAFDGDTSTLWYGGFFTDSGGAEGSSPNQFFLADGSGQTVTDASSTVHYGSWLTLELPHKLQVSSIKIRSTGNSNDARRRFKGGKLFGSNTHNPTSGTISGNYYQLGSRFDFATSSTDEATFTINATTAYKYITLLGDSCWYDGTNDEKHFYIHDYQIFGTGVDSVPIQIGGGNIDKVANFRVYDKFVGEDQALEIWDAQKDEFGRAKSSMTLQKGRLGIGTDEPEGRLAVLDEPNGLEEFPPRAMTAGETYFEGHGVFKASSEWNRNSDYEPFAAFNKYTNDINAIVSQDRMWWSSVNTFTGNPGVFNGDTTKNIGGYTGVGLKLEMPYSILCNRIDLYPRNPYGSPPYSQNPRAFKFIASKDNEFWDLLHEETNFVDTGGHAHPFHINTTQYYKYFAIIVTGVAGNTTLVSFVDLQFFGTREQGQSVLHDGQLTLTKSLTVPRIGPALDADDTPRRDRLVVEYNTSTNPTFEGAVRDTSGRGLDGVFYGGASYDATGKALGFNKIDNQYVNTNIQSSLPTNGNFVHSFSMWFNPNSLTATSGDALLFIGDNDTNTKVEVFIESDRINFLFGNNSYQAYPTIVNGRWYHLGLTYNGIGGASGREIYLDGVKLTGTTTHTAVLNLTNGNLDIGRYTPDGTATTSAFDGSISNFKLYDTALTAEEVKTLYDMGRCDEGHHVVNFSKTRVGIGLGDGEAPRAALDVREQGIFRDILFDQRSTDNNNGVSVVRYRRGGEGGNYWKNWVNTSNHYYFNYNGDDSGYFASSGPNTRVQNFTGQHRTFIKDVPFSEASNLEGLIVSSDQNKYIKMSGGIEAGSNAITTNESLPVVSLSTTTNDKKCFGVISTSEDPETREDTHGILTSIFEKEKGDTRVYINSVGEGAIWVVNIGGSLEAGDYITTSNVTGYGQKQDDDVLHNYTVAKITMDCDFEPVTQPVQQILRSNVVETYYLGNVHHTKTVPHEFMTTTVTADDAWSNVSVSPSDVTYAEWSNLEANTQNTYTLTYTQTSNVVYDVKYTKTTTANVTESDSWDRVFVDPPGVTYAEYSNLEANTQNTYTLTYTQTTTDEKTPDEWSTLESNVQSLYNKVYYQSVEEEVAATWPGAVAHTRVTDVIENELDEHGQIQWEDHATETEKAYKIRYLDASGVQTDSANAVHIAAFVGCTYHCG